MKFTYNGTDIYYKVIGEGEPILFLHGWQACHESFSILCQQLMWQYKIIMVDFPPFGKSGKLIYPWSLEDYADMTKELLKKLEITNFNILAHSFGGRVAINLCCCYNCNVNKLILTGSAGLKPKRNLLYFVNLFKYKLYKRKIAKKTLNCKQKLKNNTFGSEDYRLLDETMKVSFVKIVNTHQDKMLKCLQIPTLLVFGKNDKETPIYMAKKFKKNIKNSRLVVLKDCGHFCFLEQPESFYHIVKEFLQEDNSKEIII